MKDLIIEELKKFKKVDDGYYIKNYYHKKKLSRYELTKYLFEKVYLPNRNRFDNWEIKYFFSIVEILISLSVSDLRKKD